MGLPVAGGAVQKDGGRSVPVQTGEHNAPCGPRTRIARQLRDRSQIKRAHHECGFDVTSRVLRRMASIESHPHTRFH